MSVALRENWNGAENSNNNNNNNNKNRIANSIPAMVWYILMLYMSDGQLYCICVVCFIYTFRSFFFYFFFFNILSIVRKTPFYRSMQNEKKSYTIEQKRTQL